MTNTRYRPDIDGLRAIAVLAVLGYHAFPQWTPGGFAGVDVFFVISGYLITLVILHDLQNGAFSLLGFYSRRIRRIFPALLVVLAAVLLAAWFTLLESQLRYAGKQVAVGESFLANIFFWRESGYFDGQADKKVLLHLWSLAIEEQFYLAWPILLFAAWKKKVSLVLVMLLVMGLAFGANVRALAFRQESAFYLPSARVWELAIGGLLAVVGRAERLTAVARSAMSGTGAVCVMAAFFLLDSRHPYPGFRALLPTVGTALLIGGGPQGWLNRRILSTRLLVGCGMISYPLYLWHWPLLSIGRLIHAGETTPVLRAAILAASAVLAFLSYRLVERPMRFGGYSAFKSGLLVVLMVIVGGAGWAAVKGRLIARSNYFGAGKVDAALTDWQFPGAGLEPFLFEGRTFYRTTSGRREEIVGYFGDSQAMQYAPRVAWLAANAPGNDSEAVFLTQGGCPSYPNAKALQPDPICDGFFEKSMSFLANPAISTVVVSFLWRWQALYYRGDDGPYQGWEQMLARFRRAGKQVYVILDIPAGLAMAPESMIERQFDPIHWQFAFKIAPKFRNTADVERELAPAGARVREAAQRAGAATIDPVTYLCAAGTCSSAEDDGEPRYWDDAHLRAKFVRERITFLDRTLAARR